MRDAESFQRLQHGAHRAGIALLVIVHPPGQNQNRNAADIARNNLFGMARDAALRETFELAVGMWTGLSTSSAKSPRPEPSTMAIFGAKPSSLRIRC